MIKTRPPVEPKGERVSSNRTARNGRQPNELLVFARGPPAGNAGVRLEIGARGDHWPAVDGQATPYVAEEFPALFSRPAATVRALSAERTFWEKVTLLHAEYHRPAEKPIAVRLSRHYFDVVRLFQGPIGERALADRELLRLVVRHKAIFFSSSWANYQTACPGSLRVLPPPGRMPDIERDYRAMKEMFFATPPRFEELLDVLAELESRLNQ